MALKTFGTSATTLLRAFQYQPVQGVGATAAATLLPAADLAAIGESIVGDGRFAATNPSGILCTGTTHATTTLDTLVSTAGGPLAAIQVGMLVLGIGISPGTFVTAIPTSTSVTLSQAATGNSAGIRIGFIPLPMESYKVSANGQLFVPGRGVLQLQYGDWVVIDNTGWPILLSAATVAYAGTAWTHS